jgi:hypothetical protein
MYHATDIFNNPPCHTVIPLLCDCSLPVLIQCQVTPNGTVRDGNVKPRSRIINQTNFFALKTNFKLETRLKMSLQSAVIICNL